jgi:hypothetical protein
MQGREIGLHNFILMWPKSNPKTQIAVLWSFGSTYIFRFSPSRRAKLPHSPPLSPRAQAPPFWRLNMKPMERDVPLKACPDLSCGRRRHCLRLAYDIYCLKTYYRNHDEWRQEIIDRINELRKEGDDNPETKYLSGDARADYVYNALKKRARELGIPGF